MAAVDLMMAFGLKWGENGSVEVIDESQWRLGWAFIGATPPSVEQFNKLHQIADEKSNYLYAQLAAVFAAAGETPSVGDLTSLRDAIQVNTTNRFTGSNQSLMASGFQKLPGGIIIQWGRGSIPNGSTGAIFSFPIAFPNNCLRATISDTGGTVFTYGIGNFLPASYTIWRNNSVGIADHQYIAIGY